MLTTVASEDFTIQRKLAKHVAAPMVVRITERVFAEPAGSPLARPRSRMRDPRYRFSDEVRTTTRAAALRMIHAGTVAASPEALGAWIAQTDDLRETLTNGGYGSAFTAEDLFPLFQGYVAKATTATAAPARSRPAKWLWIGLIVIVIAIIAGVMVVG